MSGSSRRTFLKGGCSVAGAAAAFPAPVAQAPGSCGGASASPLFVWNEEPQRRIFPHTVGVFKSQPQIALEGCRGERVSAQLGLRSHAGLGELSVRLEPLARSTGGQALEVALRTRVVGLVPCQELGMLTPDPLLAGPSLLLDREESRAFWLDFEIPRGTPAGRYRGTVELRSGAKPLASVPLHLDVLPSTLPDPRQFDFFLSIWQDPASIARCHRTGLWSEEHWSLIARYARNSAAHGQKTITATVVEDPWASQTGFPFPSMVVWRNPGEWLSPGSSRFTFDYAIFDRYVETLLREGIRTINCFSPTHWGTFAYFDQDAGKTRYRKYDLGDEWYRSAWDQFLPDLIRHLKQRGWLEQTYIAMDEAPAATMEKIWPVLRRYSPDLKIHLAGGGGEYGREAEDLCYYYFYLREEKPEHPKPDVAQRRREGKRTTFYVCTGPTHPNTFVYSPAYGARMLPWLVWKNGYDGFLRWALNSWPENVWQQPHYRWGSGDMFLIYPGEDGPLDSMRWELLFAGIQDFECLRAADRALTERERSTGGSAGLKRCRDEIAAAVRLATTNEDPLITDRESVVSRARRMVNRVLRQLGA